MKSTAFGGRIVARCYVKRYLRFSALSGYGCGICQLSVQAVFYFKFPRKQCFICKQIALIVKFSRLCVECDETVFIHKRGRVGQVDRFIVITVIGYYSFGYYGKGIYTIYSFRRSVGIQRSIYCFALFINGLLLRITCLRSCA
ncbi:hypothetical protein SDC9_135947 [bioreactor metagenome]|uniref:Uncharacterized protein n=1 Tax=bioreactor metagenome TaxID=1076179 RepID=A0A645DJ47_9ZZZZ